MTPLWKRVFTIPSWFVVTKPVDGSKRTAAVRPRGNWMSSTSLATVPLVRDVLFYLFFLFFAVLFFAFEGDFLLLVFEAFFRLFLVAIGRSPSSVVRKSRRRHLWCLTGLQ